MCREKSNGKPKPKPKWKQKPKVKTKPPGFLRKHQEGEDNECKG
jgi:hypothetical protein